MTQQIAITNAHLPADKWTEEMYQQAYMDYIEFNDLTRLPVPARVKLYNEICIGLGLDPKMRPLSILTIGGKKVLYIPKSATDTYAAVHNITRRIITPPAIVDLNGTPVIFVFVEAEDPITHRIEQDYYSRTVIKNEPISPQMLKAVSAAKRRVTLAFMHNGPVGVWLEDDIEFIPAAQNAHKTSIEPYLIEKSSVSPVSDTSDTSDTPATRWQKQFDRLGVLPSTVKAALGNNPTLDMLENIENDGTLALKTVVHQIATDNNYKLDSANLIMRNNIMWSAIRTTVGGDITSEEITTDIVQCVLAERDTFAQNLVNALTSYHVDLIEK